MRRKILGSLAAGGILCVLGSVIYKNWGEIRQYGFHLDLPNLLLSFVLFVLVFLAAGIGWGLVLRSLGVSWKMAETLRVWFYSQVTRWIPGNVWSMLTLVYLSRGIPKSTALLGGVLGLVFNMVASLLTVLLFLPWWPAEIARDSSLLLLILPLLFVGVLGARPVLVNRLCDNRLSRALLRLVRQEGLLGELPRPTLGRKELFTILTYFVLYWCLSGVAFYSFVNSIAPLPPSLLPPCILIFAFSWIVSFLAFLTPGGLGVKESVTAVMLGNYIPLGVAAIISLALRIWMILAELFCLGIVAACCRAGLAERKA